MALIKMAKYDDLGLGEDPAVTLRKERNRECWEAFRKSGAIFEIVGQARGDGEAVSLTKLEPVGSGLTRVEGAGYDGAVSGNYKPGDLKTA